MMEEKEITRKKERSFTILANALGNLYNKVSQINYQEADEDQELVQCVIKAHEDWQNAEKFFHSVSSDPDLIDHAIYKLESNKARYVYLLKQAKSKGIRTGFH